MDVYERAAARINALPIAATRGEHHDRLGQIEDILRAEIGAPSQSCPHCGKTLSDAHEALATAHE